MAWTLFRFNDADLGPDYKYQIMESEGNGRRYEEDYLYKLHLPNEDIERLFFKHEMNLTLRVKIR